jgi:hypothetical protein
MTNKLRAARHRQLAAYIKRKKPEKFHQGEWFCGGAACIGGHGALMLGWKPFGDGRMRPYRYTSSIVIKGRRKGNPAAITSEFLGYDCSLDYASLFDRDAPWQTRDAAVTELRRRADAIERGEEPQ